MKHLFKSFLSVVLAAAAVIAIAPNANAAATGPFKTSLTGTSANFITANSTSNYTSAVSCSEVDYVGVQIKFRSYTNAVLRPTFTFAESHGDTGYETTGKHSITGPAANGTNYVIWNTNIAVPCAKSIKLSSITWPDSNVNMSNITVQFFIKQPRRLAAQAVGN